MYFVSCIQQGDQRGLPPLFELSLHLLQFSLTLYCSLLGKENDSRRSNFLIRPIKKIRCKQQIGKIKKA